MVYRRASQIMPLFCEPDERVIPVLCNNRLRTGRGGQFHVPHLGELRLGGLRGWRISCLMCCRDLHSPCNAQVVYRTYMFCIDVPRKICHGNASQSSAWSLHGLIIVSEQAAAASTADKTWSQSGWVDYEARMLQYFGYTMTRRLLSPCNTKVVHGHDPHIMSCHVSRSSA